MKRELEAQHHLACAEFHKRMATIHRDRAASCEPGSEKDYHKAAQDAHVAHGEHYVKLLETASDAMPDVGRESRTNDSGEGLRAGFSVEDLRKDLRAAPAQVVIPENPNGRLMPRTGSPAPSPVDATAAIDRVLGR